MSAPTIGTASRLSGSALSIASLREDARAELEAMLALASGKICLAIDPALLPLLRLVVTEGSRYLREHSVESVVELNGSPLNIGDAESVVFLTRAGAAQMAIVASAVRSLVRARGARASARVALVPRRTVSAEMVLRDAGVLADCTLCEWAVDVLPLDDDVLTVIGGERALAAAGEGAEMDSVACVARAIIRLEDAFGVIPVLRGKGRLAKGVVDAVARSGREDEAAAEPRARAARRNENSGNGEDDTNTRTPPTRSEIDMLVVLDRAIDLVTPLVTPLSFEALLREQVGSDWLMGNVEADIATDPEGGDDKNVKSPGQQHHPPPGSRATLHLNSNDKLYREIRDTHIDVAGAHLASRAKELQTFRDDIRKRNADMDVAAIHKFVKAIPSHQAEGKSLRIFVELCSRVRARVNDAAFSEQWTRERGLLDGDAGARRAAIDAVGEALSDDAPLVKALRLICLTSVTGGGLKRSELEALRRDVSATYGFPALLTLARLETAGLLGAGAGGDGVLGSVLGGGGGGGAAWAALRKAFALMADGDVDITTPKDLHYLTSGYAPLSLRLVQAAITGAWDASSEGLKLVPGPTVAATQKSLRRDDDDASAAGARKVVLVAFVGGVTHIEISGLRFISEKCEGLWLCAAASAVLTPAPFPSPLSYQFLSIL